MPADGISLKDVTVAYERQWIESALEAAGGVQKRAAELLRIKPTTLNEMIKRYDIRPRRKKASSSAATAEAPAADRRERRRAGAGRLGRRIDAALRQRAQASASRHFRSPASAGSASVQSWPI